MTGDSAKPAGLTDERSRRAGKPGRRARTPTVLQMEAAECGAASLAMVLAHYGLWAPLAELRDRCRVTRDGSRAGDIVRAARSYGLTAAGYRYDIEQLRGAVMPAVLFVNLNHFVVLEGFAGGLVHINDPATGRRALTAEEFDRCYSGVALIFEPNADFRPAGRPPSAMRRLFDWLEGGWPGLLFVVAAGVGLILPGLAVPGFTRVFIDSYLIDNQTDWFWRLIAAMAGCALLQGGLLWLKQSILRRLETRVSLRAAGRLVWRLLRLPFAFFGSRYAGAVGGRADLAEQIAQHAGRSLSGLAVDAASVVFFGLAMLAYSAWLAAAAAACAAVNAVLFLLTRRKLQELQQKAVDDQVKLTGKTMQGLQMIESLKASGVDGPYFEAWSGLLARSETQQQGVARVMARLTVLPEFVSQVSAALVLALGGFLVMRGELTIGALVAFQALQAAFMQPVGALTQTAAALQGARGPVEQFDDVLDHAEAPEFAEQATAAAAAPAMPAGPLGMPQRLSGRLSLRGLTFGYSRHDPPLIDNFNLELKPGARVALVGGSGSGKSTVGKLITGLIEPWSGEILFDGRPMREIPRALLRSSVASIDQEIVLFDGAVRDNITLWDADMPESHIVRAARDAEIHDAVVARPGGYAGMVRDGGRNFSGGQRQRLEIARALVGGPTLLVLDEATSALDPLVEKAVMDNLRRRGCACVIIAHRLSAVRDCDEIIVMHRGGVLQRGTHDALIGVDGPYRTLINA